MASRSAPGVDGRKPDLFDKHIDEMPPHRAVLRAVEAKLMSKVSLRHPVLDIGAGDGHFASVTYRELIDAGVDLRFRDLLVARSRPGVYRLTSVASGTALPFRDGAFGTVLANCVMEHIPDLEAALGEVSRVLAPGGVFAATLPSEHFPDFLLGSSLFRFLHLPGLARVYGAFFNRISYHYHVYSLETWRTKLETAGLQIVEHRYYFSAAAHRALDLSHYLGVPTLLSHTLTGRWVLHPWLMAPFAWWLRRYYEEPFPQVGAYQFVLCHKIER
jgi:SAM-dependent methyltransferase